MRRIMLVDDDQNILNSLRRLLFRPAGVEAAQPQVEAFVSAHEALKRARTGQPFDVIISDYRMPEMDGVTFLKAVREIQPNAVRLILSGQIDLDALAEAINEAEIYRFIAKPCSAAELLLALEQAYLHHDRRLQDQALLEEARLLRGELTHEQIELRRLEAESPGITEVRWGDDGSVLIDDESD